MFGRAASEARAIQALPWGNWGDGGSNTWAGPSVSSSNATQLLTVFGAVQLITDLISTLPIDVYRKTANGREDVPTPAWLVQPEIGVDSITWRTKVLTSLLLDGNAFCAVMRSPDTGSIVELVPLNSSPGIVTIRRESGRRVFYINGQPTRFDVLHIPGIVRAGDELGMSPVEAARQSIGGGMAVQEFSGRFFGQGATMSGVIEVPGALPPEGDGSGKALARAFAKLHSGKNKAHLPAVLTGGATWKSTGVTPEQAQFLQTRGYTAAEIAGQMFLLDPSDLGIAQQAGSSLTYANLEQRSQRRLEVALMRWIIRLETALSSLLAAPRYVKLNTNSLLRADTLSRWQTYEIASRINTAAAAEGQAPVLLTAEMRDIEDRAPLPAPESAPTPGGATNAA